MVTDQKDIRKLEIPLKAIFWVQVSLLAISVVEQLWWSVINNYLSLDGGGDGIEIWYFVLRIVAAIGAAAILIVALRMAARFKKTASVWPLYAVVAAEVCSIMALVLCVLAPMAFWDDGRRNLFLYVTGRVLALAGFVDMALLSFFVSKLCAGAMLPEAESRWGSTARGFLFIYALPNAILLLLPLLPSPHVFFGLLFVYRWPVQIAIAVATRYPLLLFYKSITEMLADTRIASAEARRDDVGVAEV